MARGVQLAEGREPGEGSRTEVRMSAFQRLGAVLIVLALLGGPAREAAAQTSGDVQRALEITQGVIDRAGSQLSCPPGEQRLACS